MERKDLENLFEDVLSSVKDGLNKLAQKTDQLTQIGRIKLDIISIKRDIEKQFTELGGRVYQLYRNKNEDVLADDEVKGFINRIEELETRLEAKKEELEKVQKREAMQKEAEPQPQESAATAE
ncbi:MAG: hypothetical protein Q9P90_19510 [candidate division KSB1 bacterium]|nr:hypothetical protein [candidate division KSB1 bacterium]